LQRNIKRNFLIADDLQSVLKGTKTYRKALSFILVTGKFAD
jgi:hypothetical protein